jgi:hypothetical protein
MSQHPKPPPLPTINEIREMHKVHFGNLLFFIFMVICCIFLGAGQHIRYSTIGPERPEAACHVCAVEQQTYVEEVDKCCFTQDVQRINNDTGIMCPETFMLSQAPKLACYSLTFAQPATKTYCEPQRHEMEEHDKMFFLNIILALLCGYMAYISGLECREKMVRTWYHNYHMEQQERDAATARLDAIYAKDRDEFLKDPETFRRKQLDELKRIRDNLVIHRVYHPRWVLGRYNEQDIMNVGLRVTCTKIDADGNPATEVRLARCTSEEV